MERFPINESSMRALKEALQSNADGFETPDGFIRFTKESGKRYGATDIFAGDTEDASIYIRISGRSITPVQRVTIPTTGNSQYVTLKSAVIPIRRPFPGNWTRAFRNASTDVDHRMKDYDPGAEKDRKYKIDQSRKTFQQLMNEYVASSAFQNLKESTQKQYLDTINTMVLAYIIHGRPLAKMAVNSLSQHEADKLLTDILQGKAQFKRQTRYGEPRIAGCKASRYRAHEVRIVMNSIYNKMKIARNPFEKRTSEANLPKRLKHNGNIENHQLKDIWEASESLNSAERGYVRFLMLTAQRRNQAANLRWDWISWEQSEIRFPGEFVKGRKDETDDFIMPMSRQVKSLLLARQGNGSEFVFENANGGVLNNLSRMTARIDTIIAGQKHERDSRKRIGKWRLHGFRDTAGRLLGENGKGLPIYLKLIIAQKVVSSGDAVGSYWDDAALTNEKRELFQILGDAVEKVVS